MKALISPNELSRSYDGTTLGQRVAQISETEFSVSEPLFWIDCPDECVADKWYYSEGQLYIKPEPVIEEPTE